MFYQCFNVFLLDKSSSGEALGFVGEEKVSMEGWVGRLYGSVGVRWFAVNVLYGLVYWFAFFVVSGVEVSGPGMAPGSTRQS